MDFLRLYLGEITGLVLVLMTLFGGATIAARYFHDRKMITVIRNVCIAATIVAFALSLIPSLMVNQTPRGRIDRAGADQDQKAFERRHSDQAR